MPEGDDICLLMCVRQDITVIFAESKIMDMGLNETPSAERIHIVFYGRTNSGKSSLVNALTGQSVSIVSAEAGTTTDPVNRAIELPGMGACMITDTAGLDDGTALGELRAERTVRSMMRADIAVVVMQPSDDYVLEAGLVKQLKSMGSAIVTVLNKVDTVSSSDTFADAVCDATGVRPVQTDALHGVGMEQLLEALRKALPSAVDEPDITGELVGAGDVVYLVMPQDIQAPKGRLILPQVQTIRELLDKHCTVVSCTVDCFQSSLAALSAPPKLIITDSQAFGEVYRMKPRESMLTSFSVLFAGYKGDMSYFMQGAEVLAHLGSDARILIAEACTHIPQNEDIGRVKLPRLLRKRFGERLTIDIVSGNDFPSDLSKYDLIIQCGACMFNRRHVLGRVAAARRQSIPMTNYGVALAFLAGILDKVVIPHHGQISVS